MLFKKLFIYLIAFATLTACSTPVEPALSVDQIHGASQAIKVQELPATRVSSQNYTWCFGCLSNTFSQMVFLAGFVPLPETANSSKVSAENFRTEITFISHS